MSIAPAMYPYKGYKITVRAPKEAEICARVDVFDPKFPRHPSLYKTTSLDEAMRWIDATTKPRCPSVLTFCGCVGDCE